MHHSLVLLYYLDFRSITNPSLKKTIVHLLERSREVCVKGMYLAPDIHEHFTIHKWLRQTAYIFTHNFNNLEHIANNCMRAMTHTDVTTAHH